MASKRELERRIEKLERQINQQKCDKYSMFGEWSEPTLRGKVDAILNHLGIEIIVKKYEEKVVARKVKK